MDMKTLIVIAFACASLGGALWLAASAPAAHGLYATTSAPAPA